MDWLIVRQVDDKLIADVVADIYTLVDPGNTMVYSIRDNITGMDLETLQEIADNRLSEGNLDKFIRDYCNPNNN